MGVGKGNNPNSRKNLKPIKKGQVLNPAGRGAENPYIRELRKFTNEYLKEVIEQAVMGNLAGLKAIVEDPNAPAIQVGVAKCMFEAISKGDWNTFERIFERIIGKVPIKVEAEGLAKGIEVMFVKPDSAS